MSSLSPALAFLAGALSILSPCVLPLLPIILGGAASAHRWGPVALAAGLAVSFTVVGLALATIGYSIGLDGGSVRLAGGVALGILGAIIIMPALRERFASATGPIAAWGQARLDRLNTQGLGGQASLGAVLGLVWSPCVGPTLGAATLLASQGRDLSQVAFVMLCFGLGAAGSLALVGYASRRWLGAWRSRLRSGGELGRLLLGLALLLVSAALITGADKWLETHLLAISPDWLTRLTTRF